MPSKIIGCGGRTIQAAPHLTLWVRTVLQLLHVEECIDGGAPGADTVFHAVATDMGIASVRFFANWTRDGRAAGPRRNAKQLRYLLWAAAQEPRTTPYVIALPGGKGTGNMIAQAVAAGVHIIAPSYPDMDIIPLTIGDLQYAYVPER